MTSITQKRKIIEILTAPVNETGGKVAAVKWYRQDSDSTYKHAKQIVEALALEYQTVLYSKNITGHVEAVNAILYPPKTEAETIGHSSVDYCEISKWRSWKEYHTGGGLLLIEGFYATMEIQDKHDRKTKRDRIAERKQTSEWEYENGVWYHKKCDVYANEFSCILCGTRAPLSFSDIPDRNTHVINEPAHLGFNECGYITQTDQDDIVFFYPEGANGEYRICHIDDLGELK